MNKIRQIQELNKRELEAGVTPSASWHTDYRDTAFIYVGGLPFDLSEGDIITIFSQYGEPTYINLVRDKETGKSKGFCFLKYEDQRSTDLAVDNLGGATLMGRMLSVDHTRYKRRDDEEIVDNTNGVNGEGAEAEVDTDTEGADKKHRRHRSNSVDDRPMLKEERELAELERNHDDDDPMKQFLIDEKQAEVKAAVQEYDRDRKRQKREGRKHKHRHHHSRRHAEDDGRDRARRQSTSRSPARGLPRSRSPRPRRRSDDDPDSRDRRSHRDNR